MKKTQIFEEEKESLTQEESVKQSPSKPTTVTNMKVNSCEQMNAFMKTWDQQRELLMNLEEMELSKNKI